MKALLILYIALFTFYITPKNLTAQTPNVLWVEQGGSSFNDEGLAVATDGSGNSIITGWSVGNAVFGNDTLTGQGRIFVAKYDGNGNELWARRDGALGGLDAGLAIATDGAGNIIVTGSVATPAIFDPDTLVGAGGSGMFLAKYNGAGLLQWVKGAGGSGSDAGNGVTTDVSGNIFVTGVFNDTAFFENLALISAGSSDIFIARYNPVGQLQWVKQTGGPGVETPGDIAVDKFGGIAVTGTFRETMSVGDTALVAVSDDIFIAKYDGSGSFLWARQIGGTNIDQVHGIAADSSGNFIITGNFHSTAIFGNDTLISAGGFDVLVAKYSGGGNFIWAKQAGGSFSDKGLGVAVDEAGNSFITGFFQDSASFGDSTLVSDGMDEIFAAGYDGNGQFLWATQTGGTLIDRGWGLAIDIHGNTVISGTFQGSANFGNFTITTTGGNPFNSDVFIAKLETGAVAGLQPEFTIPAALHLFQNYPNPFNPVTTIRFTIPQPGFVSLIIYDILGRKAAVLINEFRPAGNYTMPYDAGNLTTGLYLLHLRSGKLARTRKMIIAK